MTSSSDIIQSITEDVSPPKNGVFGYIPIYMMREEKEIGEYIDMLSSRASLAFTAFCKQASDNGYRNITVYLPVNSAEEATTVQPYIVKMLEALQSESPAIDVDFTPIIPEIPASGVIADHQIQKSLATIRQQLDAGEMVLLFATDGYVDIFEIENRNKRTFTPEQSTLMQIELCRLQLNKQYAAQEKYSTLVRVNKKSLDIVNSLFLLAGLTRKLQSLDVTKSLPGEIEPRLRTNIYPAFNKETGLSTRFRGESFFDLSRYSPHVLLGQACGILSSEWLNDPVIKLRLDISHYQICYLLFTLRMLEIVVTSNDQYLEKLKSFLGSTSHQTIISHYQQLKEYQIKPMPDGDFKPENDVFYYRQIPMDIFAIEFCVINPKGVRVNEILTEDQVPIFSKFEGNLENFLKRYFNQILDFTHSIGATHPNPEPDEKSPLGFNFMYDAMHRIAVATLANTPAAQQEPFELDKVLLMNVPKDKKQEFLILLECRENLLELCAPFRTLSPEEKEYSKKRRLQTLMFTAFEFVKSLPPDHPSKNLIERLLFKCQPFYELRADIQSSLREKVRDFIERLEDIKNNVKRGERTETQYHLKMRQYFAEEKHIIFYLEQLIQLSDTGFIKRLEAVTNNKFDSTNSDSVNRMVQSIKMITKNEIKRGKSALGVESKDDEFVPLPTQKEKDRKILEALKAFGLEELLSCKDVDKAEKAVKKFYRNQALLVHPDKVKEKNQDADDDKLKVLLDNANNQFKILANHYEILLAWIRNKMPPLELSDFKTESKKDEEVILTTQRAQAIDQILDQLFENAQMNFITQLQSTRESTNVEELATFLHHNAEIAFARQMMEGLYENRFHLNFKLTKLRNFNHDYLAEDFLEAKIPSGIVDLSESDKKSAAQHSDKTSDKGVKNTSELQYHLILTQRCLNLSKLTLIQYSAIFKGEQHNADLRELANLVDLLERKVNKLEKLLAAGASVVSFQMAPPASSSASSEALIIAHRSKH
ncbi:MAG: J domain-containing protein [Gammaproteobacteria bacterium]